MTTKSVTLLLGGARSGKSRRAQMLAEERADELRGDLIYLATAQAFDDEMTDRIARHRADRGAAWRTVECPIELPDALTREAKVGVVVLIDCLTLWVSNLLVTDNDVERASGRLLAAMSAAPCPIVIVSNETGLGIVPDNALARRFRDAAGRLNQHVAAVADTVELMIAGLALTIKSGGATTLTR